MALFRNVRSGILVASLMLACVNQVLAYSKLYVHDPHGSWRQYMATIEEVTMSVKPKGLFSEVGCYLTISERGNTYYGRDGDSLEVVSEFELPKGAVVTDLWLWVGDDIMQGIIMDKWTAQNIYNGIIAQKKDPSIIYKKSETRYELRIYPLLEKGIRRIKLTYLLPNTIVGNDIVVPLPGFDFLKKSRTLPSKLKLIVKPYGQFPIPEVDNHPPISGELREDPLYGKYWGLNVACSAAKSLPQLTYRNVLAKGYFFAIHTTSTQESFFQMAAKPTLGKDLIIGRKQLYVVDYDNTKTTIDKKSLLTSLSQTIQSCLGPKESFNVLFSGINPQLLNPTFVSANDEATLRRLSLSVDLVQDYSNLPTAFSHIQNELKKDPTIKEVILITSNTQFSVAERANALIKDIENNIPPVVKIHCIELCDRKYASQYFNNRWWYNSEYLYINLTRKYSGSYVTYQNYLSQGVASLFKECINTTGHPLTDFSMRVDMAQGWTYGTYALNPVKEILYNSDIITQFGKCNGTGDISLQTFYKLDGTFNKDTLTIPFGNLDNCDTTLRQFWYGFYISELERKPVSNHVVNEVISVSTKNRVLSKYTSFLCLEPNDTIVACENCFDEQGLNTPINLARNMSPLKAFVAQVKAHQVVITYSLPKGSIANRGAIEIYNMRGQVIRRISLQSLGQKGRIIWDRKDFRGNPVSLGTYIMKINYGNYNQVMKLNLI